MRESADQAQNLLNIISMQFGDFTEQEYVEPDRNGFEGNINTQGVDTEDFDIPDHDEDVQQVARNINAEIMDNVYGAVRNNSDGRHRGHNEFRALKAVEKEVPPGLITGADPRTIDDWYEQFRDAGITYQDGENERLTTEGEFFVEEAYRFMNRIGKGADDEEAEEALGTLYSSLSRKYDGQGDKLYGFLLMAETDMSVPDIHEEVGTTRRTAYNWANEWIRSEDDENDDIALFHGEPSDRELTDFGAAAYNMLGNQYQRMDTVSAIKAEAIEQLEEEESLDQLPFVPGNMDMVARYTDEDLVEKYMTRR